MNAKTISIVSYITIIGWLIAYFKNKENSIKSDFASYHLGQGLGVFLFAALLNVLLIIVVFIAPTVGSLLNVVAISPLIFIIFGIIAANNEVKKPVPLIGKFFEGRFDF
ncbi:DUF4870 domain-containing protein [Galbibacter sp.]|uniref:DUF4870 domain-containing protein n=1 Tax=Galbibacter sp. TaxID=2918471 RepID=UPI003A93871A